MNNIILKRRELKYYINYIDYLNLKSRLQAVFSRDRNGYPEGYYHVRSLYFNGLIFFILLHLRSRKDRL